jgi:hypothetical protein
MKVALGLAAIAVVHLAGAIARGQEPPPPKEARKLFEAGVQAYEQARYAEAAQAFERANQLAPRRARIVFALAQSLRRQYFLDQDGARLLRAVELYREYLELAPDANRAREARELLIELGPIAERLKGDTGAPPPASAPARATVLFLHGRYPNARGRIDGGPLKRLPYSADVTPGRHKIHVEARGYQAADFDAIAVEGELVPVEARLRELAAVLILDAPSGASVDIDGRSFGSAPLAGALAVAPGRHVVTVTMRGRVAWRREVDLVRGGEQRLDAELATTSQRRLSGWFLIGSGVLVSTALATGAVAVSTRADARDILARREETGVVTANDLREYNRLRDRSDALTVTTVSVLVVGIAAGVTGGLLYWLDTPRPETPPSRPLVTPTVEDDALGVSAVIPF